MLSHVFFFFFSYDQFSPGSRILSFLVMIPVDWAAGCVKHVFARTTRVSPQMANTPHVFAVLRYAVCRMWCHRRCSRYNIYTRRRRRRRLSCMHRTDKRTVSPGFLCWQESPPDDMVCVFFCLFPLSTTLLSYLGVRCQRVHKIRETRLHWGEIIHRWRRLRVVYIRKSHMQILRRWDERDKYFYNFEMNFKILSKYINLFCFD